MNSVKLFIAIIILSTSSLFSQNFPYGFNFQAVARDASGNAKTNSPVGTRLTILKGSATGTVTYQETHSTTTNSMGQFNVIVGSGVFVAGTVPTFSLINWSNDIYFLRSEIQTGPSSFSIIGTQQLMSVPYALSAPDPTPPGIIQAFGGASAPVGYLICDGTAISRTVYSKLFSAIGTAYGAGDGSTTFNLPDLRGQFLRGVDGTAGNDPDKLTRTASGSGGNTGNNVGSKQSDSFKNHNHTWPGLYNSAPLGNTAPGGPAGNFSGVGSNSAYPNTSSTGDAETRPKNIYVNFIIKY